MCLQMFQQCSRENLKTWWSKKKIYIYRLKDFIYLFFSRDLSLRGQGKHNSIKNTEANTVEGSSLVGLVSLIASLVLLLAEAYQRAPFISARIEPLL